MLLLVRESDLISLQNEKQDLCCLWFIFVNSDPMQSESPQSFSWWLPQVSCVSVSMPVSTSHLSWSLLAQYKHLHKSSCPGHSGSTLARGDKSGPGKQWPVTHISQVKLNLTWENRWDAGLQSRLLQVAGVYEFKFLRGDLCCPSFLGIRCQMALCVVTQLSHWHLAMPSSLWCLRNDRSNIGNTLSWGWQYPHPEQELAKYRKKDLDTKWILLLLENEPVTRLQLLLSFRSPCVFKLWNNLNLLWKDWITAHLTWHHLTISSRFLSWPNKRSSAYRAGVHHSLYLSRGDEMLGDSGHTWSLAIGQGDVLGQLRLTWDMLHVITQHRTHVWLEWSASTQPRHV